MRTRKTGKPWNSLSSHIHKRRATHSWRLSLSLVPLDGYHVVTRMKKAFACIWLIAFLLCLLLAFWKSYSWWEFAHSPTQTDGLVFAYGSGHSGIRYHFQVARESFQGSAQGSKITGGLFLGSVVKVSYCASNPTLNSLEPPGEPAAYVRAQFIGYVSICMFWVSLVLAVIHLLAGRSRVA